MAGDTDFAFGRALLHNAYAGEPWRNSYVFQTPRTQKHPNLHQLEEGFVPKCRRRVPRENSSNLREATNLL
jgi:hypothetical protein